MSDPSSPSLNIGNVSPEDIAAAYSGPALATNHFIVQPYGNSLRLAFLEKFDVAKPSSFRTAVSIQMGDLQTLISLLTIYAVAASGQPDKAEEGSGNV